MPWEEGTTLISGSPDGEETITEISDSDIVTILAKEDEPAARKYEASVARARAVNEEITRDPSLAVEYYQLQRASAARDELIAKDLANYDGIDAILGRWEQYHRYTDLGTIVVFDRQGGAGKFRHLSIAWPNLKWEPYCFNDRASSALARGVNVLCQHDWFGGRRIVLSGYPAYSYDDLREYNFDNEATSYFGA